MAALLVLTFAGADSTSAPQSISLPGAKVGDTVALVANITTGGAELQQSGFPFEAAISVDDEIQQGASGNSGNLSGSTLRVLLVR